MKAWDVEIWAWQLKELADWLIKNSITKDAEL